MISDMPERGALKHNARQAMRKARPHPAWVTLLLLLLVTGLSYLSLRVSGEWELYRRMAETYAESGQLVLPESGSTSPLGGLLTLALELMSTTLSAGYTLYVMRVSRGQEAGPGELFDAFGRFLRVIAITLLTQLIVGACAMAYAAPVGYLVLLTQSYWPMLLCAPLLAVPLRAAYACRQALFIMFDQPQLGALPCILLSRELMRGHKWELFKLDLSFFGWYLLSLVPLVGLWVRPYAGVTMAGYYDALTAPPRLDPIE